MEIFFARRTRRRTQIFFVFFCVFCVVCGQSSEVQWRVWKSHAASRASWPEIFWRYEHILAEQGRCSESGTRPGVLACPSEMGILDWRPTNIRKSLTLSSNPSGRKQSNEQENIV